MPRNRLPPVSLGCSAAESLREGGLGGGVTRERPSPAGGPPCHQGPLGKQSARVSCVPRAGVRGGSVAWGNSGPRAQTQSHKPSFVHTASRPSFHSSALCILQPCRLLISELTQHPSSGAKVIKSGTGGGQLLVVRVAGDPAVRVAWGPAVRVAWDPAVRAAGPWRCARPGLGGGRRVRLLLALRPAPLPGHSTRRVWLDHTTSRGPGCLLSHCPPVTRLPS